MHPRSDLMTTLSHFSIDGGVISWYKYNQSRETRVINTVYIKLLTLKNRCEGEIMSAYIKIEDLHKTFKNTKEKTEVLKGIDLSINKGEIYGIVGFSGAGKSTLVRCINRLEEPDSGKVFIGDTEITALSKKELTARRKKIGMIF